MKNAAFRSAALARVRNVSSLSVVFAATLLSSSLTAQAQRVFTHHVRDSVQNARAEATGSLAATQTMSLDLVLPLSDPSGLDTFLQDLYDPSSPNYRHFLTVQAFTERFGPTQNDYDTVVQFAKKSGFIVTGGSRDGMDVQVKGSVATVQAAFHVNIKTYRDTARNFTFFSPDREPTPDIAVPLWHISGLDNGSEPHPMMSSRFDEAQKRGISPEAVKRAASTGSGPSASYLGSDMRAAYYGQNSLTGAGQNLGLFEYYGTNLADLKTYYANVGQTTNVPISLVSTDGTSTACNAPSCDDGEQNLDMTQALGMAPGLASLTMYVGSSDTAIISAMTTHSPLPTTIGCSWGWKPVDPTTLDPYFKRMAAQGQTFFVASGDSSTWSSTVLAWPADDANVIAVGGTDLVTTGAGGAWKSETAWSASGGGISPDNIAIPTWQKQAGVITSTNKGSTTLRNGPDVSANANWSFYTCADQAACQANVYGGTSFAAPMWAAYIALINQQLNASGQANVGFLNPTIYTQNLNATTYSSHFHDILSGTSGSYSAVKGFDLVTGWGSPTPGIIDAF